MFRVDRRPGFRFLPQAPRLRSNPRVRPIHHACGFLLCLLAAANARAADPQPISAADAQQWIYHTVPLPRQIAITHQVVTPNNTVAISYAGGSPLLVQQAASELREALFGSPNPVNVPNPVWTIHLQVGGAEADPLNAYPNASQASLIQSDTPQASLRLIALTPQGVYYAAKTVAQLIRGRRQGTQVSIPVMTATDWPDMAERGVWGVDASYYLRWLSDRKLNFMEQIASTSVNGAGQAVVTMAGYKQIMLDDGPTYGFIAIPAVPHLDSMQSRGVFNAYPDLRAQGSNASPEASCYLRPRIFDIIGDWIKGCAAMNNVTEVDVWMSENLHKETGCECTDYGCRYGNRDILEMQAILNGYNQAKQQYPNLTLRILTGNETEQSNSAILNALPTGVKLVYYHSLNTYTARETNIVPNYLQNAATGGRHVGMCPSLSASVISDIVNPFSGPQFIRYRMNEFVSKGMDCLMGYPIPRTLYYEMNMEAAGEWTWNAVGRSVHDFAYGFAVRRGFSDPELFAQWADAHGAVAWDVYGSAWPVDETRGSANVATDLVNGTLPPLGSTGVYPKPWGDIKTLSQLNNDVALAAQAVAIANQLNIAQYRQESLVVQGYINSLKALYELKQLVGMGGSISPQNHAAANQYLTMYVDSLTQARTAVATWETTVPQSGGSVIAPTTTLLTDLIAEMKAAIDRCPNDANKLIPGTCGCGVPDTDTDLDGIADCADNCPLVGPAGQLDTDNDTVGDLCDNCPLIGNADQADADGDGVGTVCDACPLTPPGVQVDATGCPVGPPGDFDGDGDVDMVDFGHFQACLTGAYVPITDPDCLNANLAGGNDVDQDDFLVFQGCMTGADILGDPNCAN